MDKQKQAQEEAEKARKEAQKEEEKLQDRLAKIRDQQLTKEEQFAKKVDELDKLRAARGQQNGLTELEFLKEKERALRETFNLEDKPQETKFAGLALKGSQEAREVILRSQVGNSDPQRQLLRTNEAQLTELQQIRQQIARQQPREQVVNL